HHQSPLQLA
ncbi:hypothetical protein D022_1928B, partial [Vibrio parahaemolyticus 12310]